MKFNKSWLVFRTLSNTSNFLSSDLLTPEHIRTLTGHGEDSKNWIRGDNGRKDIQDRKEHERYFIKF